MIRGALLYAAGAMLSAAAILGCARMHVPGDGGDPCGGCRGWVPRDTGHRIAHDVCDDLEFLARLGCYLDAGR